MKKPTHVTLERLDARLDTLATLMVEGFEEVHANIGELRKNIVEVQEDIVELRTDMKQVRLDISDIQKDVAEIKVDVKGPRDTYQKTRACEMKFVGSLSRR